MYIIIEGPDYSGKSTLVEGLDKRLRDDGYEVETVREPGGTPLAEELRARVLRGETEGSPDCELFLFLAARADLFTRRVLPALEAGKIVIGDRGGPSTYAYQCKDDVSRDLFKRYKRIAMPMNPLYIFLEISYDEYERRKKLRASGTDALEARYDTRAKFESLMTAYRQARDMEPRVVTAMVDGITPEKLVDDLYPFVLNVVHQRKHNEN